MAVPAQLIERRVDLFESVVARGMGKRARHQVVDRKDGPALFQVLRRPRHHLQGGERGRSLKPAPQAVAALEIDTEIPGAFPPHPRQNLPVGLILARSRVASAAAWAFAAS